MKNVTYDKTYTLLYDKGKYDGYRNTTQITSN